MLKLMKYEFRKSRTSLIVMILVAAGLLALAGIGYLTDNNERHLLAIAEVVLLFYVMAAYVFVLIRGVTAYAGELKSKTGYLMLMTPHSTLSILVSKLLFTLVAAILMMAVAGAALAGATVLFLKQMNQLADMWEQMTSWLGLYGVNVAGFLNLVLFMVIEVLISVVAVVSIAYLAVTLSATVLQNGKLREFVSALLFVALFTLVAYLTNLVTPSREYYETISEMVHDVWPATALYFGCAVVCTGVSAYLLKRRVSL